MKDIYYQISGEGFPIVFLHGNGEDHHIFDQAVLQLSKQYQCICIDSRYHGQSIHAGELSYQQMAKDVMGVVDELKLEALNKRLNGMDIAKKLFIFATVYRYLAPVIVTPFANRLGEQYLKYKKAKEAEQMQNAA